MYFCAHCFRRSPLEVFYKKGAPIKVLSKFTEIVSLSKNHKIQEKENKYFNNNLRLTANFTILQVRCFC